LDTAGGGYFHTGEKWAFIETAGTSMGSDDEK